MPQNKFEVLFQDAFDTFKVFHNITPEETGSILPQAPTTIWQILNHLIAWQDHQIGLLQSDQQDVLKEDATWINKPGATNQEELQQALLKFDSQIKKIKYEVSKLDKNDLSVFTKLKITQDLSVHLPFHLGEIILMRRMLGTYPLPHQMKEFLS